MHKKSLLSKAMKEFYQNGSNPGSPGNPGITTTTMSKPSLSSSSKPLITGENVEARKFEFERCRLSLHGFLEKTKNEAECLWTILKNGLDTVNAIMLAQMNTSDLFSIFHEIWQKNQSKLSQSEEICQKYKVLDDRVRGLSDILDTFEVRAHEGSADFRSKTRRLSRKLEQLQMANIAIQNARNFEDLANLTIPDISEIKNEIYPDLDALNSDMEDSKLNDQVKTCIALLVTLFS